MGWFVAVSGVVQLAIAAWAIKIGRDALEVSRRVATDSRRERARGDARYRLLALHDLLDVLEPMRIARATLDNDAWTARQQWVRTLLASASLRDQFPVIVALSERDIVATEEETQRMLRQAREELLNELEVEGDRAYALEWLA